MTIIESCNFTHKLVEPLKLKQVTGEDGKRRYLLPSGKTYESVTTYLDRVSNKKHLLAWQKKVGKAKAEKTRSEAAHRGTTLHNVVEDYMRNKPIDFCDSPMVQNRFMKVKEPLDRLNNIRLIESPLYSDELQLAGKPDIIAEYVNKLSVIDLKTSGKKKKREWIINYFLQAACYGVMFNEHYGEMPEQVVIVMATEVLHQPQIFIEPMTVCIGMLKNFMKDPVLFQQRVELYKP